MSHQQPATPSPLENEFDVRQQQQHHHSPSESPIPKHHHNHVHFEEEPSNNQNDSPSSSTSIAVPPSPSPNLKKRNSAAPSSSPPKRIKPEDLLMANDRTIDLKVSFGAYHVSDDDHDDDAHEDDDENEVVVSDSSSNCKPHQLNETLSVATQQQDSSKQISEKNRNREIDEGEDNDDEPPLICESSLACLPEFLLELLKSNRSFIRLAAPSILIQFLRNFISAVSFAFAGRLLDGEHLAGFFLGFSFTNAIGVAIGMGVASVLDTLCPAAFGFLGSRNTAIGVHLRTAIVVAAAYSLLYFITSSFLAPRVIGALKPELVESATAFLVPSFMNVFGTTVVTSIHKFLNAQSKTHIALGGYVCGSTLTLLLAFGLYHNRETFFENDQIQIIRALSLTIGVGRFFSGVFMFVMAMRDSDVHYCWTGEDLVVPIVDHHQTKNSKDDATKQRDRNVNDDNDQEVDKEEPQHLWEDAVVWSTLKPYLELCSHSIVATCADRWTFEVMTVLIAMPKYTEKNISQFQILVTIWIFMFPFPTGAYVASSTLVGSSLGRGKHKLAQNAATKSLIIGCGTTFFISVLYALFPSLFVRVFVSGDEIVDSVVTIAPLFAAGYFLDSLQYIFQAIFRATGDVVLVSKLSIVSQWLISLPVAAILVVYYSFGVMGLGGALISGSSILCASYLYFFLKLNWEEISKRIQTEAAAKHSIEKILEYSPYPSFRRDRSLDSFTKHLSIRKTPDGHSIVSLPSYYLSPGAASARAGNTQSFINSHLNSSSSVAAAANAASSFYYNTRQQSFSRMDEFRRQIEEAIVYQQQQQEHLSTPRNQQQQGQQVASSASPGAHSHVSFKSPFSHSLDLTMVDLSLEEANRSFGFGANNNNNASFVMKCDRDI